MAKLSLSALNERPKVDRVLALAETNAALETLSAEERIVWALENLHGEYVLSSSFGIQAAVSLHLVNQVYPGIPVILTDTGYLFAETYQFIDELTEKLNLNLKVYRAKESAAWQEARYGKLWEQGIEGIEKYNDINKVEPLNRALHELSAQTGLRACVANSPAVAPHCRCWRFSAASLRCCRLSTGIIVRSSSICKSTDSSTIRCGIRGICQ